MSTHTITFAIQGMTCANCAITIERALARLDGVIAAHVNYATERATVVYDPTRVSGAAMLGAVRNEGFDAPLERVALNVGDLLYASSARTVEQVLERADGVARATANLKTQQIVLDVLGERAQRSAYENAIAALGLRVADRPAPNPTRPFVVRTLAIVALALLSLLSAGAHAGLFALGALHVPLVVVVTFVVGGYGLAWRFYRAAFDTFLRGKFDVSVLVALIASASLLLGLPLALIAPTSGFANVGFIVAIWLTAGWFSARALTATHMPARSNHLAPQAAPIFAGTLAAGAMFGMYVLILTAFQDFAHAMRQAGQDWLWVGLVALGFGAQIGLYVYLSLRVSAAKATGATVTTGAGTGTSTLGMVACCAHHLIDLAPLVALTGASSLSGAIAFLNEWKYAFIALGLIVNAIGIVITVRTIQKSIAHLNAMAEIQSFGADVENASTPAPACH